LCEYKTMNDCNYGSCFYVYFLNPFWRTESWWKLALQALDFPQTFFEFLFHNSSRVSNALISKQLFIQFLCKNPVFCTKNARGEGRLEVGGPWTGDASVLSYKFLMPMHTSPVFCSFFANLRPFIWFKGSILSDVLPSPWTLLQYQLCIVSRNGAKHY